MERVEKKQDVVMAIDIGTTKVCAIAGFKNDLGKLEVLGIGKVNSEGVLRGVVSNIEKTVNAIQEAIEITKRSANIEFNLVHVGIAGQHIKTLQHRGQLVREYSDSEISQKDIDRLVHDIHKLVLPPGDKILHAIPQEFSVDSEHGILDPVGMSGVHLGANFHIITGQITATNNIYRCVERAGAKVANMTLEPIASAMAVLNEEEKQAGVVLVDIGGGTTDITIFYEGIIRHTSVIPLGGNIVTKDIKEGCTVMPSHAENLKTKFGCALSDEVFENRIISIPGLRGRDHKEISEKNLSLIIQARMEEIFDHVFTEISSSGYGKKLVAGIVLTGGGALLRHVDKLAELHTGLPARIGLPVEHLAHGYSEKLCSPIYATAIGLLLRGIEDKEKGKIKSPEKVLKPQITDEVKGVNEAPKGGIINIIIEKTREWFDSEPDSDL
mgnify:CR=1 FL=1